MSAFSAYVVFVERSRLAAVVPACSRVSVSCQSSGVRFPEVELNSELGVVEDRE